MKKQLQPENYKLRALKILRFPIVLILMIGLACQQGGKVTMPVATTTQVFYPGLVATQLARPTQERNPIPLITTNPATTTAEFIPPNSTVAASSTKPAVSTSIDQYYLAANLQSDIHRLDVHQVISYTNRTGAPLYEIKLVIEPDRQEGVFNWEKLSWKNESLGPERTSVGLWKIELPSSLGVGQVGILDLSYYLALKADGGVLGYSSRQINFGDWYVRIPPFQPGIGWLVHEPGTAGEHNVYDQVDFKVELDLGVARQYLVVAASALGQHCGDKLCYTMKNSRGFDWSASEDYHVLEVEDGGILLQQFVFPDHVFAGKAALEVAQQAVRIFQADFGAYPYSSLAMVEADFFDGMEYPGMFFLGQEYYANFDGSPKGYLTSLTAHEIAHQWWFGLVGNDQALEPWLDEALSTYSELIYYQAQYPELTDWWWEYRVTRFQPGGPVDSTIYDQAGFRPYVNAVYLRGAQFLQELRISMGEDTFKEFIHAYFNAYNGKIATTEDFFTLAGQFINPDKLQSLRQMYFSH